MTGDVGPRTKAHCHVLWAREYLQHAVKELLELEDGERWHRLGAFLEIAESTAGLVLEDLSEDLTAEALELIEGKIMRMEALCRP